jgi:hypothetical protein
VKYFFAPIVPFVWHPERAAIMAVGFVVALTTIWFLRKRFEWLILIAALAWSLFAFWEHNCKAHGYNIRVDLFLIYPILLAVTLLGIIAAVAPGFATRTTPKQFSMRSLMILVTLVALALGTIVWLAR